MRKGQHTQKQIEMRDMVIFIMSRWLKCGRVYSAMLMLPDLMKEFDKSENTMRIWIKEVEESGLLFYPKMDKKS